MPRSGTTLVGRLLALPPRVGALFEPFHPDLGVDGLEFVLTGAIANPGIHRVEFPFIDDDHPRAAEFQRLFLDTLAGRAPYRRLHTPGRHGRLTTFARRLFTSRLALRNHLATAWPLHRRWVIKDPHLCLAAGHLHGHLGVSCVVTVRHPAATSESWRRLGWNPDLRQFWEQPGLWSRHLDPYPRPDPARLTPLERAAHLWLWIHRVLLDLRTRHPGIVFVRLEDLALDPIAAFRNLYVRFDLPFSNAVQRHIQAHMAAATEAVGTREQPHQLHRASRSVVEGWRSRLSGAETAAVRRIVGDTSGVFYPEDAW